MAYSADLRSNVELLEERARAAASDEMERASSLDQKSAGLIAAALVLVAAAVAFASQIDTLHGGHGARALWAVLALAVLVLLLLSLGFATAALRPRPYRIVIDIKELQRWPTPRFLQRDPTTIRGELLRASIAVVREARPINKTKAKQLQLAFTWFAAAVIATVVLGSAVAIRVTDDPKSHAPRRQTAAQRLSAPGADRRTGGGCSARPGDRPGCTHVR